MNKFVRFILPLIFALMCISFAYAEDPELSIETKSVTFTADSTYFNAIVTTPYTEDLTVRYATRINESRSGDGGGVRYENVEYNSEEISMSNIVSVNKSLIPGMKYQYMAFCSNGDSECYGEWIDFVMPGECYKLSDNSTTNITDIPDCYGTTLRWIEYTVTQDSYVTIELEGYNAELWIVDNNFKQLSIAEDYVYTTAEGYLLAGDKIYIAIDDYYDSDDIITTTVSDSGSIGPMYYFIRDFEGNFIYYIPDGIFYYIVDAENWSFDYSKIYAAAYDCNGKMVSLTYSDSSYESSIFRFDNTNGEIDVVKIFQVRNGECIPMTECVARDSLKDKTGWVYNIKNGYTCYYQEPNVACKGYITIDGYNYYFNYDGYMVTGWINTIYGLKLYGTDGKEVFGFVTIRDKTFYLNPDTGYLVYGYMDIDDNKYYFDDHGEMLIDGVTPDGDYSADEYGVLHLIL